MTKISSRKLDYFGINRTRKHCSRFSNLVLSNFQFWCTVEGNLWKKSDKLKLSKTFLQMKVVTSIHVKNQSPSSFDGGAGWGVPPSVTGYYEYSLQRSGLTVLSVLKFLSLILRFASPSRRFSRCYDVKILEVLSLFQQFFEIAPVGPNSCQQLWFL